MRMAAMVVAGLSVLSGCVETPAPGGRTPLRSVESDLERVYLRCVARDPLFTTPACQQVRARLSDDPYRGSTGR